MPSNTKLSNYATTITGSNGVIRVTYHATDVVTFDDKTITLNTGGYETVTTKRKMVQASAQFHLGYRVASRDGVWLVTTPRGDVRPFKGNKLTFTRAGVPVDVD